MRGRDPKLWKRNQGSRRSATRRAERAAAQRRYFRAVDGRDHRKAKPVHPRDRYWYARGLAGEPFNLLMPSHGGGSYFSRYLAMHAAGANAREKAEAA